MTHPADFNPVPVFTDAERAFLESKGSVIRYPNGCMIMEENESTDYVLLILSGHVKVVDVEHDRLARIVGQGNVVGELAAVLGSPRAASIYAIGNVTARHLPAQDWLAFLRDHPRALLAQMRVLALKLAASTTKQAESLLGAERKLAKTLLELLAAGLGEQEAGAVALRLNQKELGDLAGISRESVVQNMRNFKAAAIVSTGRHVTRILDQGQLRAVGDGTVTAAGSHGNGDL